MVWVNTVGIGGVLGGTLALQGCGSSSQEVSRLPAKSPSTPGAGTSTPPTMAPATPAMAGPHDVGGTITVFDGESFPARTGRCFGGATGYDDLSTGSQVTMTNESGKVVGVGVFGP